MSDCSIISVASFFSHDDSGVFVSWCQRISAPRMIAFTMLAESKCFEPLYTQYNPVTRSYTETACSPFRPRRPAQMSAETRAASAR